YLDHCAGEIRDFLGTVESVLFVPYALFGRDAYAAKARARFAGLGYKLHSVHDAPYPQQALAEAKSIFVGGGNTFRLLKALYDFDLLDPIRKREFRTSDRAPVRLPPAQRSRQLKICPSSSHRPLTLWDSCRFRSARITWTPIRLPRTWARPRKSAFSSI